MEIVIIKKENLKYIVIENYFFNQIENNKLQFFISNKYVNNSKEYDIYHHLPFKILQKLLDSYNNEIFITNRLILDQNLWYIIFHIRGSLCMARQYKEQKFIKLFQ